MIGYAPRNDGTAPWIDPWATGFCTSNYVVPGSSYTGEIVEEFSEAAKRAAELIRLSLEAIDRWIVNLRKLRPHGRGGRRPVLKPARACSLSGSWRAQGPP